MTRIGLLYVDDFFQPRSQRVGSLGLASIAAWLEQEIPGVETRIGITAQDMLDFEPHMVGISAYSETLPAALEQARLIRQKRDIPIVLGGPHMATNPNDLRPEIDIGVVGEGEETMEALVRALQNNSLVPSHLKTLPGLSFRDQGQLVQTGRCPPIEELDRLAHPNRPKMFAPLQAHFSDFKPLFHVHTARGCPYRCTFCSAPLVNPQWRFHSPEWVVTELENIARHYPACDQITLSDDLFTLKKSRLEELVKAIREAGLHKRFFFLCSSRSNTLSPEICKLLVDMNMLLISFGMESGSDRIIKALKGGGTSQGDYQRVLDLCNHFGLHAHGNFIIGDQQEHKSDLQATWDFIAGNTDRFATAYVTHMTPFPGTKVWDMAVASGRFLPQDVDYRLLNLEFDPAQSILLSEHYSRDYYADAHSRFKQLSESISARFTEESGLIKDVLAQERWEFAPRLAALLNQAEISHCRVLSPFHTNLPERLDDCQLQFVTEAELAENPDSSPLLLYHQLSCVADPAAFVAQLPPVPLLSFDYHRGHYYNWVLLLLGQWQEGHWGGRQRHFLKHFTLKSLERLFLQSQRKLVQKQPFDFRIPLPEAPLKLLRQIAPLEAPETFAWLTYWQRIESESPGKTA
jgi:anaerobic magnesium-protoporphyrin IX monomethyl ester cyclase